MSNNSNRYFMNKIEILDNTETAFAEKQFCVYYQPQFNHSNKRIIGAEALVRWIHPEYGMQSPGDFIPVFEENGYITRLDLFVFEEVCAFQKRRIESGDNNIVPVSFNVSRFDVYQNDFINCMEEIRNKYDVPVKYLRVEITESSMVGGNMHLSKVVDAFHKLGYVVEMDDFGSGYSSLNMLKDVEIDIIKLDMLFLRGEIGGRGGIIISSVIRMANWLGTPVIAEGVETAEQADYLRSLGCEYIQGYLYSKPVPEADFTDMLKNGMIGKAAPHMKFIEKLDAEKFWSPDTLETIVFNNFVGGAAILAYENDNVEVLRVNEKYIKEMGMNSSRKELIPGHDNMIFDDENSRIFIDTIKRAIESNEEEECETWRTVYSQCCGEDRICIKSHMRVIGSSDGQYLIYTLVSNITAEKNLYQALYDNEKKFRTAGEHANIYAWEYEIDTKIMRPCSRCIRDLGLPHIVKNYPDPLFESGLFPRECEKEYREMMRKIDEGAQSVEGVFPLTADHIPFHVRYTAEFDENGRPYKAYGSATLVVD